MFLNQESRLSFLLLDLVVAGPHKDNAQSFLHLQFISRDYVAGVKYKDLAGVRRQVLEQSPLQMAHTIQRQLIHAEVIYGTEFDDIVLIWYVHINIDSVHLLVKNCTFKPNLSDTFHQSFFVFY